MSAPASEPTATGAGDERLHPLVLEVRRRGSDARDVRDAAHEAHHALTANVRKWDRESIHRGLMRKIPDRGFGIGEEILARAVERLVCDALNVPGWSVETAARVMWMEMLKVYGISLPTGRWTENAILRRMKTKEARDAADRVLALIDAKGR